MQIFLLIEALEHCPPANLADLSFTAARAVAGNGDPAGLALNLAAGPGLRNNGSILIFSTNTLGFNDVLFEFDASGTGSALTAAHLEYSTDGTSFGSIHLTSDPSFSS